MLIPGRRNAQCEAVALTFTTATPSVADNRFAVGTKLTADTGLGD